MRELEATVMATAAELGEMQDVHICALEEAVRLIKVTELREKEEELASYVSSELHRPTTSVSTRPRADCA